MTWTTPDLCDAHPDVSVADPLFRDFGGRTSFCGRIRTVRCLEDNSRVRELLGQDGHGQVLVVDGGGSLRRSLLGDQLAALAIENGWDGVLVHGAVRDVEALALLPIGIKAIAAAPKKTQKRGVGEVDVTLALAGVDFAPGSWLYADANGVVVATDQLAT